MRVFAWRFFVGINILLELFATFISVGPDRQCRLTSWSYYWSNLEGKT